MTRVTQYFCIWPKELSSYKAIWNKRFSKTTDISSQTQFLFQIQIFFLNTYIVMLNVPMFIANTEHSKCHD